MMLFGPHLSNRQWRRPQLSGEDVDLLKLMAGGAKAVKLMSYHTLDVWDHVRSILRPERIIVRLNHPDDWPNLADIYRMGNFAAVLEIYNEPNNPVEGFGSIEAFIAAYIVALARAEQYCPTWQICFPGLSPAPALEPTRWWADPRIRNLIATADYLGVHSYYTSPQLLLTAYEGTSFMTPAGLFPGKRLLLTEFACTAGEAGQPRPRADLAREYAEHTRWVASLGYVDAEIYYLLGSDDPRWRDAGETFDEDMARAVGALRLEPQPVKPAPPAENTEEEGETMATYRIGNLDVDDLRAELPDEPGKMPAVPFGDKDFISVHHTVTGQNATAKAIYDYHKGRGWGGIGYNFLVFADGRIQYVGECNTVRAAVGQISQGNRRGIHIALVGDFSAMEPPPAMLDATKRLIANIQHAYGWWLPALPHRMFNSNSPWDTACPGDQWCNWWPRILRAVGD